MTICQKHNIELNKIPGYFPDTFIEFCDLCEKEQEEREISIQKERAEKNKKKLEQEKIEKRNKGIPIRYQSAKISDFNNIDLIFKWLNSPIDFLFISGQCGTGKTHLAAACAYFLRDKEIDCAFVIASNLFLNLRNSFNSEKFKDKEIDIIKFYCESEIAIFDDIGAQKISDYVIESWYNIIDTRYGNKLPTIFTSNMNLQEISIHMSDRIASRIASGKIFELIGKDRRLESK